MEFDEFKKGLRIILGKVLVGPAYTYEIPASKNFQNSEGALQNWITDIEMMNQSFEVMGFVDKDTDKTIYELVEEKAPDEQILQIMQSKKFDHFLYGIMENENPENYPEHEDLLAGFKELLTPNRVLEIATAPFITKSMIDLCKEQKDIMNHEHWHSNIFKKHKELFSDGLKEIAALQFPKGDTVKLAEFMATDETFGTFLKDVCGMENNERLCNSTLPMTVGSLVYYARDEEKITIRDKFLKKDVLSEALDIGYHIDKSEEMNPTAPENQVPSHG
jgi:hypothetical protein